MRDSPTSPILARQSRVSSTLALLICPEAGEAGPSGTGPFTQRGQPPCIVPARPNRRRPLATTQPAACIAPQFQGVPRPGSPWPHPRTQPRPAAHQALTSKCTMRREWRKTRPLATSMAISLPRRLQLTFFCRRLASRLPPSRYSVTSMVPMVGEKHTPCGRRSGAPRGMPG